MINTIIETTWNMSHMELVFVTSIAILVIMKVTGFTKKFDDFMDKHSN